MRTKEWGQRNGDKGMGTKEWGQRNGDKGMGTKEWEQRNGNKGMGTKEWEQRNGNKGMGTKEWGAKNGGQRNWDPFSSFFKFLCPNSRVPTLLPLTPQAQGVTSPALTRMKRRGIPAPSGVRSRTTNPAGESSTTTVAAGPEAQVLRSEETCTVSVAG
jgi:hypothetical protein